MGRRTKYHPDYARQARYLAETFGATNEQLADLLNCSTSTLWEWARAHEELASAIKGGKAAHDGNRFEQTVLACALGFYQLVQEDDGNGNLRWRWQYFPPSPKAQLLWGHNRMGWGLPTTRVVAAAAAALPGGELAPGEQVLVEDPHYLEAARGLMERRYGTRIEVSNEVKETK